MILICQDQIDIQVNFDTNCIIVVISACEDNTSQFFPQRSKANFTTHLTKLQSSTDKGTNKRKRKLPTHPRF